jgi:hypothetical protein
MESQPIGTTFVNVGVKGTAACPSLAQHKWVTPAVSGNYCIQVFLDCPDDANPGNNLGQTNTDVRRRRSAARRRHRCHRQMGVRRKPLRLRRGARSQRQMPAQSGSPLHNHNLTSLISVRSAT